MASVHEREEDLISQHSNSIAELGSSKHRSDEGKGQGCRARVNQQEEGGKDKKGTSRQADIQLREQHKEIRGLTSNPASSEGVFILTMKMRVHA